MEIAQAEALPEMRRRILRRRNERDLRGVQETKEDGLDQILFQRLGSQLGHAVRARRQNALTTYMR
jgi:hypothetical protein